MSLVAELTKLQERKTLLLQEVAAIDRDLEAAALALGLSPKSMVSRASTMGPQPRGRTANGQTLRSIKFWLGAQSTAKSYREIAEGVMCSIPAVSTQLTKHADQFIHRGNRWGLSESQFTDHSADLEEQSHGNATPNPSTSPTVPLMNGQTVTSPVLTTTASTALVGTE